jgi:hypothetical protein
METYEFKPDTRSWLSDAPIAVVIKSDSLWFWTATENIAFKFTAPHCFTPELYCEGNLLVVRNVMVEK